MRPTRAEISTSALRHNLAGVRRRVGPGVRIMGIVKANAYGHGITEVSRTLAEEKIDCLGVGFLDEGVAVRRAGVNTPILVLGGVLGDQIEEFLADDLDITISSIELARRVDLEVGRMGGKKARIHLKIDTGMERIGVRAENAAAFALEASRLPHLELVGIYSHFATADEKDKSFAREQFRKFTGALKSIDPKIRFPLRHMANSGAILDLPETFLDMVRAGMMLYGLYPSKSTNESVPLTPVLSLRSKVVFIKEVPEGASIGYGRTYVTKGRTKIATVPIGYGDGYSRMLSHKAEVLIRGRRHPVVGTVCMDQLMVNVGLENAIHVGDDVTLIGKDGSEEITAWEIAEKTGTNQYEVLCMIAARVPRVRVE